MPTFTNEFTYKKFLEDGREGEFDNLFDNAVEKAKHDLLGKRYPLYINGKEVFGREEITEHSPIDGQVVGRFQRGTRDDAKLAISAASAASPDWSATDYTERIAIFRKAAKLISRDKFVIAAALSIENGKTRYESIGEVDEAIDFINYYASDMERNKGYVRKTKLSASRKQVSAGFQGAPGKEEKVTIAMRPYGVFGVIAPFNFPISISTGMSTGALITGNTVVYKPSSTDSMAMLSGILIYRAFAEAGLPNGVFNYVSGPGSEVGDELVVNPTVSGIAFTGSRAVGISMIRKSYDLDLQKAFVMEMGSKNPAIVAKSANLDDAVEGIASAAFGYSGQKCSACSRVYVHESVKSEFISKLLSKVRSFKIGDPLKKENYVGPLISKKALEKYAWAVGEAKKSGRIIHGGNVVKQSSGGVYVEPTIVEAEHGSVLFKEELFVPFLLIDTFKDFGLALEKANDVPFGLTAGLYSRKKAEIRAFIDKIQFGVLYINRATSATTGAIVGLHTFVGWRNSSLTGKGTGSRFYLDQFMREQSQAVVR
jgi:1-pyrroline-5-carboxylate dehydrogenase